ncbi:transcriptional regulator, GntR family [Micromonospora pallida]|uniref:GntR family transcriptional regulator n=1 Tax=Micromonospora pallida TaxID=145854 RepID=A0A1C6TK84_9ACTN|nr:GntR family transcriptional regulator [Micromonospora pallida]SCL42171.1 GntR family transcriptional regulator [Micromonospora pallida]SCL43369.1 transcriptional regulator, GntR family [Micromonospora pallida]
MSPPRQQPRYRQIADDLRRRIESGMLPAGAPLPTEVELMQEWDVARGTVREAIGLLRAEGLISTARHRGSHVRPRWPVRRLGPERYRVEVEQRDGTPDGPATSFTADQRIGWDAFSMDKDFAEVGADERLAELLQVDVGTPLLRRHFVFRSHGVPQQISTSYLLLDMVAGTPVADPDREPWPGGNTAQLASLGVRLTRIIERPRTRMPSEEEARILAIGDRVPVMTITRISLAGDRPVETALEIVLPGDRVELEYVIDL